MTNKPIKEEEWTPPYSCSGISVNGVLWSKEDIEKGIAKKINNAWHEGFRAGLKYAIDDLKQVNNDTEK